MANTHLAPDEAGESWGRLARFREFERQQKAGPPDQLDITDPRITELEFTGASEDIKTGQWVETMVEFRLDGVKHCGWVQHAPMDSSQNAGTIESVEAVEVESIEALASDAAADEAGEELVDQYDMRDHNDQTGWR